VRLDYFLDDPNQMSSETSKNPGSTRMTDAVIVVVVVLLSPLLLLLIPFSAYRLVSHSILVFWFQRTHAIHGRHILFVYSDSPNWKAHVEERILPRIRKKAVILNWSERRHWHRTNPWEARFFRRFAGDREFSPIALILLPGRRVTAVRFHRAFLDLKHGKQKPIHDAEATLFDYL